MASRASRRLATCLVAALLLFAACGEERPRGRGTPAVESPTPAPSIPPCELPERVRRPRWLPRDLPLPNGTYATERLGTVAGYHRALFVVPGTLLDLIAFVGNEWPAAGYELGAQEQEAGETEVQFQKGPAVGAMKANQVFCDPGYLFVLLIYAPTPPPTAITLVPSPSPTG